MTLKPSRKTVGALAKDLSVKKQEKVLLSDQRDAMLVDYEKNLYDCASHALTKFDNVDFFVVVITKKEPLFENTLRHYFVARQSCPTPDYDQTVYKYHRKGHAFEFIWVIPSKDTCLMYLSNVSSVHPKEYDLLKFVTEFADGTLRKRCKRLNNEEDDSNILVK